MVAEQNTNSCFRVFFISSFTITLKHHILENTAREAVLLRWFYKQNEDTPEVCIGAFNPDTVSKMSSCIVTHIGMSVSSVFASSPCHMRTAAEMSSSRLEPSEQCYIEGSGLLQDVSITRCHLLLITFSKSLEDIFNC